MNIGYIDPAPGGDAYVSKPFSTRSLTDQVGELMGDAN